MNDRTIMQMEVHPQILRKQAFRASLRRMGETLNKLSINFLKEWKSDRDFLEGEAWTGSQKIGSVLNIRIPQRYRADDKD